VEALFRTVLAQLISGVLPVDLMGMKLRLTLVLACLNLPAPTVLWGKSFKSTIRRGLISPNPIGRSRKNLLKKVCSKRNFLNKLKSTPMRPLEKRSRPKKQLFCYKNMPIKLPLPEARCSNLKIK
jgi:hypothetical protein